MAKLDLDRLIRGERDYFDIEGLSKAQERASSHASARLQLICPKDPAIWMPAEATKCATGLSGAYC